MKTIFLAFCLFSFFISLAQKESNLILKVSKLDKSEFFFISVGEEIIFTRLDKPQKVHGFVSDILLDSIEINNSYYITLSEIRSLVSRKERKNLQTKAWTTTLAGLLFTIGGGGLLQHPANFQKTVGGSGVIFGIPYFMKGIRMITDHKTCSIDTWEVKSISPSISIVQK